MDREAKDVAAAKAKLARQQAKKRKPAVTMTLRGAACHRFLRTLDPTFPLHPDEEAATPAGREALSREKAE